MLVDRTRN